jgi:hypothetical protein
MGPISIKYPLICLARTEGEPLVDLHLVIGAKTPKGACEHLSESRKGRLLAGWNCRKLLRRVYLACRTDCAGQIVPDRLCRTDCNGQIVTDRSCLGIQYIKQAPGDLSDPAFQSQSTLVADVEIEHESSDTTLVFPCTVRICCPFSSLIQLVEVVGLVNFWFLKWSAIPPLEVFSITIGFRRLVFYMEDVGLLT